MTSIQTLIAAVIIALVFYFLTKNKATKLADNTKLHSLPSYYGYLSLAFSLLPFIAVFITWSILEVNIIKNMVVADFSQLAELSTTDLGLKFSAITLGQAPESETYFNYLANSNLLKNIASFAALILGFVIAYFKITPSLRARNIVENLMLYTLVISATIAILTTIGIVGSVLFESIRFFGEVSIFEFLFGTHWSPQIAIREDQVGGSGAFGAVPLFWGTLFISFIAMFIAVPIGLSAAIYLSEYAASKVRHIVKPFLEILAGVPTVVYGFFAAITIGPMFRDFGNYLRDIGYSLDIEIISGMVVSTESALAAGVVMGMMIVPFVLSLSDDVISAVPHAMRDGSTALGATKSETVTKVLIPAALPGIIGSFLLAISRAIGETMIVLMAAGVAAKLTANPFDSVTTITVQIVTLLTGDQEFDSVKTLSAFALALGLFATTLALNIIALKIVRKYREQYE
jgi:phosphate transport system permease protein